MVVGGACRQGAGLSTQVGVNLEDEGRADGDEVLLTKTITRRDVHVEKLRSRQALWTKKFNTDQL